MAIFPFSPSVFFVVYTKGKNQGINQDEQRPKVIRAESENEHLEGLISWSGSSGLACRRLKLDGGKSLFESLSNAPRGALTDRLRETR